MAIQGNVAVTEPVPSAPDGRRPPWVRVSAAVLTPLGVGALWSSAAALAPGRLVPLPEYGETLSWSSATGVLVVLTLALDLANLSVRDPRVQLRNWWVFQGALMAALVASSAALRSGGTSFPVVGTAVIALVACLGAAPLLSAQLWRRTGWAVPLVVALVLVPASLLAARAFALEPADPWGDIPAPVACTAAEVSLIEAIDTALPDDPLGGGQGDPQSMEGTCQWYGSSVVAPQEAAALVSDVLRSRGYTVTTRGSAADGMVELTATGSGLEPVGVGIIGGETDTPGEWVVQLELRMGAGATDAIDGVPGGEMP